MVLPYKDVTQSGPLLISYNYNLPVIASNHPGFAEYISQGVTGFLFNNCDEKSLAATMIDIVEGKYNLDTIVNNLEQFIRKNVSLDSIVKKYVEGFNLVLKDE